MKKTTISLPSDTATLPTRIIIVSLLLFFIGLVGLLTLHPQFIPKPSTVQSANIE